LFSLNYHKKILKEGRTKTIIPNMYSKIVNDIKVQPIIKSIKTTFDELLSNNLHDYIDYVENVSSIENVSEIVEKKIDFKQTLKDFFSKIKENIENQNDFISRLEMRTFKNIYRIITIDYINYIKEFPEFKNLYKYVIENNIDITMIDDQIGLELKDVKKEKRKRRYSK